MSSSLFICILGARNHLLGIPQLPSSIWGGQGTRHTSRPQTVESPKHGSIASGGGWWRFQCLGDKTSKFHHCPQVLTCCGEFVEMSSGWMWIAETVLIHQSCKIAEVDKAKGKKTALFFSQMTHLYLQSIVYFCLYYFYF